MLGIITDAGGHPEQHFHVGRDANEFFCSPFWILSGVDLESVVRPKEIYPDVKNKSAVCEAGAAGAA